MMWSLGMKYGKWKPPVEVADEVLERLARFKPFIFQISQTRRSVYIHFAGLPNGLDHKLRISDHDERERYGYKWQLRLDGIDQIVQKRWSRYFREIDELVECFIGYYHKVEHSKAPQMGMDWGPEGLGYRGDMLLPRVNDHGK
jgi:hypothetical protein